jgi:osmotically-inducible protein OsmY
MKPASKQGGHAISDPQVDEHVVRQARRTLDTSCLRGWSSRVRIESHSGCVTLSGRLPSYYLKQVLQTIVGRVPGVQEIDNHVAVEPRPPGKEERSSP